MSLEIIKAGLHDSVQDEGRFGYQYQGINPSGAMDRVAMKVANALVGNDLNEAVIELCFPAAHFVFQEAAFISLSGANFNAMLNGVSIPLHQLIRVPAGATLKFTKKLDGSFCYLAIRGGFQLEDWLGSKSTNTKVKAGGWKGRTLLKSDRIPFLRKTTYDGEVKVFPWRANVSDFYSDTNNIRCIKGNEFGWLDKRSQERLVKESFTITRQSDRMGYRLEGDELTQEKKDQLLSTAVVFGTVQLLPNGQLIILCADHQTTGGYPRMANVITADHAFLVQGDPGSKICFKFVTIEEAEQALVKQNSSLRKLAWSCKIKLETVISQFDDDRKQTEKFFGL